MQEYQKLSDAEYHALEFLSQSSLKPFIDEDPAQALAQVQAQRAKEPTDQMRFGTLAHSIMLEDLTLDGFKSIEKLDGRTKEGRKQAADLEGRQDYLWKTDYDALAAMKKNFLVHTKAQKLIALTTNTEEYGLVEVAPPDFIGAPVLMKFKPDMISSINDGFIADYKTIGEHINAVTVNQCVRNMHYDYQLAAYQYLDELLTGKKKRELFLIFQETIYPFGVGVAFLGEKSIQRGREKFFRALKKYIDSERRPEKMNANHNVLLEIKPDYWKDN